ncbi:hypothetical protein ATHL_00886 [Anaerolinea thermolimosa]|nr:hypothetical protein ATHL_00886 [Anaerolinea thermolimosa]
MSDFLMIMIVIVFFLLMIGFVSLCNSLLEK